MIDERLQQLTSWLAGTLQEPVHLEPIVGDASFRRYFRFNQANQSFIAMDAPPALEDAKPFVAVANSFAPLGVRVPTIYAADIEQGFLVLEDLGDKLYLRELTEQNADILYGNALDTLMQMYAYQDGPHYQLPHFNAAFMMKELAFF